MPKRAAASALPTRAEIIHGSAKRRCYTTKDEDLLRAQEFRVIVSTRHAVRMQRYRTHKLAVEASKYGMTRSIATTISYQDLSTRLADPILMQTMKRMLHRVCVLTAEGVRDVPVAERATGVNLRMFLLAFKIAYHVDNVFEEMTKREEILHVAAKTVMAVFDSLCLDIADLKRGGDYDPSVAKALKFHVVLYQYIAAFKSWRQFDSEKCTNRISHALRALYEADSLLTDKDTDELELRNRFRKQIEGFRRKLLAISGESVLRRIDALQHDTKLLPLPVKGCEVMGCVSTMSMMPPMRRMTNEQLAHELQLDPSFTLNADGGESPMRVKLRQCFEVISIPSTPWL